MPKATARTEGHPKSVPPTGLGGPLNGRETTRERWVPYAFCTWVIHGHFTQRSGSTVPPLCVPSLASHTPSERPFFGVHTFYHTGTGRLDPPIFGGGIAFLMCRAGVQGPGPGAPIVQPGRRPPEPPSARRPRAPGARALLDEGLEPWLLAAHRFSKSTGSGSGSVASHGNALLTAASAPVGQTWDRVFKGDPRAGPVGS